MKISCPHCYGRINIVEEATLSDINCPSCGSSFDLVPSEKIDETIIDESSIGTEQNTFRTIGRFELIEEVGSGAFGNVWRGNDPTLDRKVAVKIPRKGQLTPFESELFFREARAAAQLKHANIVPVHEIGKEAETIYIVSEFVDGKSLADHLIENKLAMRESASLCKKVALALDHAHSKGVIHRDLKPSNIMLDLEYEPYVMDFGLAKRDAGEITMTLEGRILGTPAYMSPEQAKGEGHHVDGRADVYSVGVMLFELLTGELPFRGNQRMLLHQVIHDEATSPRKLNNSIPKDLETICLKCLEKQPVRRYESARALADDLDCYLVGKPISARPVGAAERTFRWCQRNPALASVVGLASLLIAAVAIGGPMVALQQTRIAEQNKSIAQNERENANQQTLLAEQNQAIAKREKENADQQRENAKQQTEFAKEQANLTKLAKDETEQKVEALNNLKRERSRQFVNEALRAKDSGKPYEAMVLLDQAIESSDYDPEVKRLNVNRFRMLWQQYPISGFWNYGRIIRFDPENKIMAIGDAFGGVQIWDNSAQLMIQYFKPHNSPIIGLAFDESGKIFASSAADGTLRVVDMDKDTFVGGQNLSQKINDIWFTKDGLSGYAAVTNEFLQLNLKNTNQPAKISVIKNLAYSKFRSLVAVYDQQQIKFLNMDKSDSTVPSIEVDGEISSAEFSVDGSLLAVALEKEGSEFTLQVFNCDEGKEIAVIPKVQNKITKIRISNDAKLIAYDQEDESQTVKILQLEKALQLASIEAGAQIKGFEFSTDSNFLAVMGQDSAKVKNANFDSADSNATESLYIHSLKLDETKVLSTDLFAPAVNLSTGPDGAFFVTTLGGLNHHISGWQFGQESADQSFSFDTQIKDVALDEDGKVYAKTDKEAYQLDTDSNAANLVESEIGTAKTSVITERQETRIRSIPFTDLAGAKQTEERPYTVSVPFTNSIEVPTVVVTGKRVLGASQGQSPFFNLQRQGKYKLIEIHNGSKLLLTNEIDAQSELDGQFVYRLWDGKTSRPASENLVFDRKIAQADFSLDGHYLLLNFVWQKPESSRSPDEAETESQDTNGSYKFDFQILDVQQGKMVTDIIPGDAAAVSSSVESFVVAAGKTVRVIEVNSQLRHDYKMQRALASALVTKRVDEFGELVTTNYSNVEIEAEKSRLKMLNATDSIKQKWHIASTNWALNRAQNQVEMFDVARLHAIEWSNLAADDPTPNALLGSIYGLQGKLDEALKSSERAVELDADILYAWTNLASLKLDTGDKPAYKEVCRRIWEKFGNSPDPSTVNEAVWIQTLWTDEEFDGTEFLAAAEKNYEKFPAARNFANSLIAILVRMNKMDRVKKIVENLSNDSPGHELATKTLLSRFKIDIGNKYALAEKQVSWVDQLQAKTLSGNK